MWAVIWGATFVGLRDPDIPATGLALWDTISFRIYRDPTGTDTYAWTMCLSQIGFHYQRDTNGSRQEYAK